MAAERASFEIQVMRDGRWSTETVAGDEQEARVIAKKFLANKKCEGARIVRNWTRSDGRMVENEVFSETRSVRDDGEVRIVPIDSAPDHCETPEDFYGPDGRNAVNRILRNYFEKVYITPTELMHTYKELKRVQDKDTLVPSAVDRVAGLQTRDGSKDARTRRDELFRTIDQISTRARRAETIALPKINGCFSAVLADIAGVSATEDPDFLAMVVLSRDLIDVRNWLGKLERLCKLAVAEGDPHCLSMLDGVIADVLGANVVQEILGWQPSLGQAIRRMVDLADGCMPHEKSEAGESLDMLNKLFSEGKLPVSRACLIDRVHRQIRSPNPLNRNDNSKELDEYARLIERLLLPGGFLSGPDTVEALTTRYTRMVEQGGASGRRAAIIAVMRAMPDRAAGAVYLSELARTDYAKEHAADIVAQFDLVFNARILGDLCARTLSPKDKLARATLAHRSVKSSPFPAEIKVKVADHIDSVVERYLVEEQVIEKLDHPDSHLRDRAVRLLQFCAAGILPEGKALSRARERILHLLRQPNFDAHFIDGIPDPIKAQKALRDFHHLLQRAGFG